MSTFNQNNVNAPQSEVEYKTVTIGQTAIKYEEKDIPTLSLAKQQTFSVSSYLFQEADPQGVDAILGYTTLNYLKSFFGSDFAMPHGTSVEDAKAFVDKVKWMGLNVYEDEDQYIIAFDMENKDGQTMQIKLQLFLSGRVVTSAAFVEILHQDGFRDVEAELERTIAYYELLGKGDASNVKASMVRPSFIADQKLNYHFNVVRRKSSVQLSTDYAQASFALLSGLSRYLNPNMNILAEMIAVKNKLGMTEDDCKQFSEAANGLQAEAINAMKVIEDYRKGIERRAIEKLGLMEFPRSKEGQLTDLDEYSPEYLRLARSYGLEIWKERFTQGDKKSFINQVQTDTERDELAMLNEEYSVQLAQELRKACDGLGENAMMKMAVAEYIRKYADPSDTAQGFKMFWDIFEDGLVQALHEYENMDKNVVLYNAPAVETPAFFVHDNAEARLAGLEEVKALKAGDVLKVVPQNGVMVLKLEAGDFKVNGLKTQNAFPVVPEGHWFEAPIISVSASQKATRGLSIRIGHVELKGGAPTPPEQDEQDVVVDFALTAEALEFIGQVVRGYGSLDAFIAQEFFVLDGMLHMKSDGQLVPVSHVNTLTVEASQEPVAVDIIEIENGKALCR